MKSKFYFGRTRSRKTSLTKEKNLKKFLKENRIITISPNNQLILEIGIGMGENLIHLSKKNKKQIIIGIDPFKNGIINVSDYCVENNIKNIFLFPFVFQKFLNKFKSLHFNKIYILFPDPWPKKKHHKRRILNEQFFKKISKILKKNGKVYISTDNQNYYESIQNILSKIENTKVKKIKQLVTIKTKYYLKAEKKKNKIISLMLSYN